MPVQWTTNRQFTAPAGASAVVLTPNAVAWTDSDPEVLIASADADLVLTGLSVNTPGDSQPFEMDILVDSVVVTTFAGEYDLSTTAGDGYIPHVVPLDNIPEGSEVSVLMRKAGTSVTAWHASITYWKKPLVGNILTTAKPQKVAPSNSRVTVTGANATDWGNGTWVQVLASAGADLVLTGAVCPPLTSSLEWEMDIGEGTAPAGTVRTTLRGVRSGSADGPCYVPLRNPLTGAIASGNGIVARLRETDTAAARNFPTAVTYHEAPL